MKSKAQISLEILVVISFVIMISIVVMIGINEKNIKIQKLTQTLQAKRQSEKLASAINNALYNGDGFTNNVTLSKYVANAPILSFIIRQSARSIEIVWPDSNSQNNSIIIPIATNNIGPGLSGIGDVTITSNLVNVYNNQSRIQITQY